VTSYAEVSILRIVLEIEGNSLGHSRFPVVVNGRNVSERTLCPDLGQFADFATTWTSSPLMQVIQQPWNGAYHYPHQGKSFPRVASSVRETHAPKMRISAGMLRLSQAAHQSYIHICSFMPCHNSLIVDPALRRVDIMASFAGSSVLLSSAAS
jgi:hypothetical protein